MKILIYEPVTTGHHLHYLKMIVKGISQRIPDNEIILLTRSSIEKHELFDFFSTCHTIKEIIYLGSIFDKILSMKFPLFIKEIIFYIALANYVRKNRRCIDTIFVPYIDIFARVVSIFGFPVKRVKWFGISMIPAFHLKEKESQTGLSMFKRRVEKRLFNRLLKEKYLKKLFVIDPLLNRYVKDNVFHLIHKISYLPDPGLLKLYTGSKVDAKIILEVEATRFTILIYGAITKRKGVSKLLKSLSLEKFPDNCTVIVAGKIDNELFNKINAEFNALISSGKVILINKYIDADLEGILFKSADLIWLGYKDFWGMSGVLAQAIQSNTPVLANSYGLTGWFVTNYKIGRIADTNNPEDIAQAIQSLISDKYIYNQLVSNTNLLKYDHSVESFQKRIADKLYSNEN